MNQLFIRFSSESLISFSYFLFFSLIFIFPIFGSIDKVGAQIFYLSLINTFYFLHLLFNYKKYLKPFFFSKINISFILFLISCLISFFWSYNIIESVVKFSYWFNVYISFFISSILFRNLSLKYVSLLITAFAVIHLSLILSDYLNIINNTIFNFEYSNYLKGLASNKNISSALIFFSIPFLIISALYLKNYIYSTFIFILSFLSFYFILASSSRSVFIAVASSCVFIFIFYFFIRIIKINFNYKSFFKPIFIFFFIPLFSAYTIFNSTNLNQSDVDLSNRITTINTDDTSTSNRLRFYNHALNQVLSHPFMGVGLGNWKFKSIESDYTEIRGYIVPYHVHNDFLEIATELGLIGFLSYLSIFLISVFFLFYFALKSNSLTELLIYLFLGIFIISYFIDANLNFPHARLIQQFYLVIFLSFIANKSLNKID